MSNITKNHKVGIFAIFIASALMLGTISVVSLDTAFATKGKNNEAEQEIEQDQSSRQSSQCVSGVISLIDCNNVGVQAALNLGNNALGQQ